MIFYKTFLITIYFVIFVFNHPCRLYSQSGKADGNVVTVVIPSKKMHIEHKALVFLPEKYKDSGERFPVLYLLHGYTGYYSNWYEREPRLKDYATRYGMIIVTPEGNYDSWYIDSPEDSTSMYETYIAVEVREWIDRHFRTKADRRHRAISGLSMGGNGALCIAADYPEAFGAASGMSSAVDLRKYYNKWNLKQLIGDIYKHPSRWFKFSFAGKLYMLNKGFDQAFLLDCGVDDMFFEDNEKVHRQMLDLGIKHDFFIRPGGHSWDYWRNALPYHLLFFEKYFEKN